MCEADFFKDMLDEIIVDFEYIFDIWTSPVTLSMTGKTIGRECELHALAERACPINVIDNHIQLLSALLRGGAFS